MCVKTRPGEEEVHVGWRLEISNIGGSNKEILKYNWELSISLSGRRKELQSRKAHNYGESCGG